MKHLKVRLMLVMGYLGAVIGAGFASGQEIMQFFVNYGSCGLTGALTATFLFALMGDCCFICPIASKFLITRTCSPKQWEKSLVRSLIHCWLFFCFWASLLCFQLAERSFMSIYICPKSWGYSWLIYWW